MDSLHSSNIPTAAGQSDTKSLEEDKNKIAGIALTAIKTETPPAKPIAPQENIPTLNQEQIAFLNSSPSLDRSKTLKETRADNFANLQSLSVTLPPQGLARAQDPAVPCARATCVKMNIGGKMQFLHANQVTLGTTSFLCAQAPLDATRELFWRSALDKTHLIIDLTTEDDLRNPQRNLVAYSPEEVGATVQYGDISVTCTKKSIDKEDPQLTVFSYEVADKGKGTREIIHRIHYKGWDEGAVIDTSQLKKIVALREEVDKGGKPPFIHSATGAGRAGTLCVALALDQGRKEGRIIATNCSRTLQEYILLGRLHRGTDKFVETPEQYGMLLDFAHQEIEGEVFILPELLPESKKEAKGVATQPTQSSPRTITVEGQFRNLAQNTVVLPPLPQKICRSRYSNIQSAEKTNVSAEQIEDGVKKHLHANRIDYEDKEFIVTQAPFENTVELFWKTAMENSRLLVDLTNDIDVKDPQKNIAKYYPEQVGETKKFGDISVTCTSIKERGNSSAICTYAVTNAKTGQVENLDRLQFTGWPDHSVIQPSALQELIALHNEAHHGELPSMIFCSAGVGRSGTLCVAIVLDKLHKSRQLTKQNCLEKLNKLILYGRLERGSEKFVEHPEQYGLLINYALQLLAQ